MFRNMNLYGSGQGGGGVLFRLFIYYGYLYTTFAVCVDKYLVLAGIYGICELKNFTNVTW